MMHHNNHPFLPLRPHRRQDQQTRHRSPHPSACHADDCDFLPSTSVDAEEFLGAETGIGARHFFVSEKYKREEEGEGKEGKGRAKRGYQ